MFIVKTIVITISFSSVRRINGKNMTIYFRKGTDYAGAKSPPVGEAVKFYYLTRFILKRITVS